MDSAEEAIDRGGRLDSTISEVEDPASEKARGGPCAEQGLIRDLRGERGQGLGHRKVQVFTQLKEPGQCLNCGPQTGPALQTLKP